MLLVTSAVKTVLSISKNGMNQITSNKQIDNHLNEDVINASNILLPARCIQYDIYGQGRLLRGIKVGLLKGINTIHLV